MTLVLCDQLLKVVLLVGCFLDNFFENIFVTWNWHIRQTIQAKIEGSQRVFCVLKGKAAEEQYLKLLEWRIYRIVVPRSYLWLKGDI